MFQQLMLVNRLLICTLYERGSAKFGSDNAAYGDDTFKTQIDRLGV